MVFTSRKVFKNCVRLSWGLSCTTGLPSLGRLVFICPLALSQPTDKLDSSTNLLTVHACNDLHLNLIPIKFRSSIIASSDPASTPVGKGNTIASPKTPSKTSHSSGPNDFVQNADPSRFLDVSAAKLVLADEKVKELLQIYASRWLHGRYFLKRNIIVITVLGQHCVFLVEGVEYALAEQGSTSAKDGSCYQEIKISSNSGQGLDIFVVDAGTKVHFSGSSFLDGGESTKIGLPLGHVSYYHIIDEQAGDIPRLGGLSKEFVALKEIISSSVKSDNALRRFKGVLLHGPPGTGKTSLAISCAHEAGAKLFSINGSEIMTQYYGESEQALCDVFHSARLAAPAVNCLGALDGTHILVHVPVVDRARYRNRNKDLTTNVLGVCSQDMQFIYILPGWEGSASDSRVLRDAISRSNGLRVSQGYYYLRDAGYPNGEGFLTPYRGQRYHLSEWRQNREPQTPQEFYNYKHSSARNVIERCFGLLKGRWAILRGKSYYPLKVACRIISVCALLHNHIRREMPIDPYENELGEIDPTNTIQGDNITYIETSDTWNTRRDDLALQIWNEWRG